MDERSAVGNAEDEELARLIEEAGPRPEVPKEDLEAIQQAFRQAWHERIGARGSRFAPEPEPPRRAGNRGRAWAALAAGLALAALGFFLLWGEGPAAPAASVARVAALAGEPTYQLPGSTSRRPLAVGTELGPGSEVATPGEAPEAHVALALDGGASLRLDRGSRVRLQKAGNVELLAGAVYVDTGPELGHPRTLAIATPFGVARDLGTQFEVRLLAEARGALRLRVREGAVILERPGGAEPLPPVPAGVELTVGRTGEGERRPVATQGEEWRWALLAAPPFEIEGKKLAELLAWVARETGWALRFEPPGLEAETRNIELHGSIARLTAEDAPKAVLPGAGLGYRLEGGVLEIRREGGGPK